MIPRHAAALRASVLLLWTLALLGTGCDDSADRRELPVRAAEVYAGRWEYRYGESPAARDGSFSWAEPRHDDGGWQRAATLTRPPGRGENKFLWLRSRLHGPALSEPVLLLPHIDQSFEAYLEGRLLARFGPSPLDGPAAARFSDHRRHLLRVGEGYAGRTLVLRIHSPYGFIGPLNSSQPRLGSLAETLFAMVQAGLPLFGIAVVFATLGLGCLVLFFLGRDEPSYLLYSLTCLLLSIYLICRSSMRSFLWDAPSWWYYVEISSLGLVGAGMSALVSRILGEGPLRVLFWLWRIFVGCVVLAVPLLLGAVLHIGSLRAVVQWLWLAFAVSLVLTAVKEALRGSSDARYICVGTIAAATLATYELLQEFQLLSRRAFVVHYAAGIFMLTLGAILTRRFREVSKRLVDYSTVFQLSFAAGQELSPGHQAQIALAELLRIVQAERGLLFLVKPDDGALALMAGRDAQGSVLTDPANAGAYDEKLVAAVQKKRRPLSREWKAAAPGLDRPATRQSAVASPLLAAGQLLGVLYLEAGLKRPAFGREDVAILLGLGNQMALALLATRAGKLESESAEARQRLEEQRALLEAAGRMASGDLQSPIAVLEKSELAPLGRALEHMRRDLLAKFRLLESSNAAVQKLNDELRYQIEQRLRRLMELMPPADAHADGARAFAPAAALSAGKLLGERYRVISLLGEGRSGSVYEVERTTDGQRLAAKVLRDRGDRTVALRFAREAQILARLSHPNVVSIVDVDIAADGLLFLVMELVSGVPLSRFQECYGPHAELGLQLSVLSQIAAGLRIVHERDIVHRDLKPANVLIAATDSGPQVKLVDFGVSAPTLPRTGGATGEAAASKGMAMLRLVDDPEVSGQFTAPGVLIGTPLYLAPELVEGSRRARPPSDIFSFGVIAYELLCGELPFLQPPVVTRWRGEPLSIPPLRKKRSDLPVPLCELLERCLAPDPKSRPTAVEISMALAVLPAAMTAGQRPFPEGDVR